MVSNRFCKRGELTRLTSEARRWRGRTARLLLAPRSRCPARRARASGCRAQSRRPRLASRSAKAAAVARPSRRSPASRPAGLPAERRRPGGHRRESARRARGRGARPSVKRQGRLRSEEARSAASSLTDRFEDERTLPRCPEPVSIGPGDLSDEIDAPNTLGHCLCADNATESAPL